MRRHPGAAFGGKADVMDVIAHGAAQQGTFNGNPLVAAAGLAALTEVLTPDAYEHLAHLGARLADGCQKAIDEHGIPAHTVDLGVQGLRVVTAASRSATTATSSRPTPSCSTRRTRGS